MSDVDGLGLEGHVVKVSAGYARNFLMPRKLAVPVTRAALKRLEKNKVERETRQQRDLEAAQTLAETLGQLSLTLTVKVGENDKLFGSVTASDIAVALKAQGHELDRHRILLPEPLRELGVFSVKVRLHPQVDATLKVWVVGE